MVQLGDISSLLKLVRKGNDENVRRIAAEALFILSMEGAYLFIVG